ncbi:MAG: Sec-independent protein translocase protein TatA [Anaerolineaceae bacterium]|nr:MAG: Sec-independent protein translocase protein TatA [Anaerolineaceae bacterium]
MPGLPRGAEWIVILAIVILLFGPGRIGKVAGELGKGIRSFREGLSEGKQDEDSTDSSVDKESK